MRWQCGEWFFPGFLANFKNSFTISMNSSRNIKTNKFCFFMYTLIDCIARDFISKLAKSYNPSVAYTFWRRFTHFIRKWIACRRFWRWQAPRRYKNTATTTTNNSNRWRSRARNSQAFTTHQTLHHIWFQSKNSTCVIHWDGNFCGSRPFPSHGQKLSKKYGRKSHSLRDGHDQWCTIAVPSSFSRSSNQFHTQTLGDPTQWPKRVAPFQRYRYIFK